MIKIKEWIHEILDVVPVGKKEVFLVEWNDGTLENVDEQTLKDNYIEEEEKGEYYKKKN
ncbi:MAG: hypothetical protein ACTSSB_11355 [Candidatus Heimdallarchaeota archaeon]